MRGGSVTDNAGIIRAVLSGERGPCRDIVLLNAAAALMICGKAHDLREGAQVAASCIDTGAARQVLERMIIFLKGA